MLNYFPKYFTTKAITLYLVVLIVVNILFFNRMLPAMWWVFGIVEVVSFFYFSNILTRNWGNYSPKLFTKKLFTTALIIRLAWVIFSFFFYTLMTGKPFEFSVADSLGYHNEAGWLADMIKQGNIQPYFDYINGRYSDMGYPFYLGWQYAITGKSIIIVRLLKALYSAITCVLVYKLAVRNFGEETGRMSAVFCMLMPNLIYYTGLHLKETEMVFLTVWFMERADFLIRSKKYNFANLASPLALAASLFFFRTMLGAMAFFALFTSIMFSSTQVIKARRRVVLTVWIVMATGFLIGGRLSTELEYMLESKNTGQQTSLQWRSERQGGNRFAKYASASIFAPAIFIIPFPTVVNVDGQENQMLLHGGYYVRNILAFFIMFALFWIIKEKKWRDYTLIGSFTLGYLIIIALSAFAQSERFHMPALPFLLMLAAFGISKITNKTKKYFSWYMIFIFVAIAAWSWFKLAGRGLV